MDILKKIAENVLKGNGTTVEALIKQALQQKIDPHDILNSGLIAGINDLSVLFKRNEIYIPEVLIAASAIHTGIELLCPLLVDGNSDTLPTIVIGTVKGDLHDIGKNIVGVMLEGAGFKVVDIGVNTPPEFFIRKAKEHHAKIIAVSALLTTTLHAMKITVDTIHHSDLNSHVKILIGGAPVTQHFADLIHADGYAENAAYAVEAAKRLLIV